MANEIRLVLLIFLKIWVDVPFSELIGKTSSLNAYESTVKFVTVCY